MNIAIIKETKVTNAAVFNDIETAQSFLDSGVWTDIGVDSVAELPDGYGIGDSYVNGEWAKAEPTPVDLELVKEQAIQQTRVWVEAELAKGMTYADGKIYNVTREKRADLAGVILVGKMNEENGVPDDQNILRWNVSGEEHENWLYKDLCVLAYTMYMFVTPTIEKQQHAEIQIKGAETYDEIQTILQDFM